ncbi:monocarboxylate transporter 12-like [Ylistrum balloti]|uniref:monocarboxylate transporter 12-like n=1 Tax=Ylistrum balloti TaxID=509963 RepID=UPI002905B803|nr:monocarboxylate transporter 12-like [Ylistrum balloti]
MSSNRNTVDGGYAWVILIACTLLYMTLVGTCKAFGILYNEFLEKYDAGAGNTAWISSLMFFLCFALGPLANYLVGVFSFRAVVMFGGLLVSIGYFISAFVPRMEWMFLTIGVICGFGSGLAFAPCGTIVSFYFVKRRALANGIMVSGSGLSSFVFPYLYQYCIDTFSVTGAMIIISGVILHMCVAGALLRQPLELTDNHTPFDQSTVDEKQGHKETRTTEKTCNVYLKLLRNTRLTMFIMVFTINILAYAANFVAFPAHMQSLGFHENEVALAFSMIGAAEVLTRALFGWFADKKYISNSVIMIFSGVASGTAAILLPCFKTFPVMVAYGLAVGIFPGAFWSLMAVVLLDCVPLIELTSAFGLLYIFMSSAIAFSQPGMGWIEDATGDWNLSFRMMGTFHFLTTAILLAEPLILKLFCYDFGDKEKRDDHEEEIEEYVRTSDIARRSSTIRHDNYDSKEHVKVSLIRERDIIAENETKSSHPTSKDDDRSELLAPIAATEEIDV